MAEAKRSPDDLVEASAHLHYEVSMFDATARVLMAGLLEEGAARNAFLESFAIHTRALLQFFHPSGSDASDVLAEHFFADRMMWLRLRGGVPKALSDVERRVGNEIAHLSYDRLLVAPEARNWNVHDIWTAVMGLVHTFVASVPRHLLSGHWDASVGAESSAVATETAPTAPFPTWVTYVNSPAVHQPFQGTRPTRG
jgi:hypothetical protein